MPYVGIKYYYMLVLIIVPVIIINFAPLTYELKNPIGTLQKRQVPEPELPILELLAARSPILESLAPAPESTTTDKTVTVTTTTTIKPPAAEPPVETEITI